MDGREAIQRREGHLRPSASGGPTGSASARLSGGRLAPQGCFTPKRQSPVGRRFDHGERRGCREALAGGGFLHLYQRGLSCAAYRYVPPCGKGWTNPAGSGAHGAVGRPLEVGLEVGGGRLWRGGWPAASPTTPPPSPRWRGLSSNLRQRRATAAAAAAAVGVAAFTVWDGEARQVAGWLTGGRRTVSLVSQLDRLGWQGEA